MGENGRNLLALLRSALWGTTARLLGTPDWNAILKLASQQTVLGITASAIQQLPAENQPGKEVIGKLQASLFRIVSAHPFLNNRLSETIAILNRNNIHHVLLKGEGLAMNYPDPQMRQCGDIDLYIGPDRCKQAYLIITEAFSLKQQFAENAKHYELNYKGAILELHKTADTVPGIFAGRRFRQWSMEHLSGADLRKIEIAGTTVNLPPYNFDAIYILNHIWHHFIAGGIGLRQICDWVLYLHKFHNEIDHSLLESDLESFGLQRVWKIFGELAVRHLGLPANECPLYSENYCKAAERLADIILMEGNFGRHAKVRNTPRPQGYAAGKLHSFRINAKRFLYIVSVAPYDVVKAWIWSLISGVIHFFKGLHENN